MSALHTYPSNSSIILQVVAYPIGKAMEYTLPKRKFRTFGYEWSLNPGPFNMKEHMLATIMANVTFGGAGAFQLAWSLVSH